MEEIWKPVVGFETRYAVSNTGKVKRLYVPKRKGPGEHERKEMILKQRFNNMGYAVIDLYVKSKRYQMLVHRVVAISFIENPNNYPIINHKDETPTNNHVDNLEWCTHKYNSNYGTSKEKIREKNSKAIYQIDAKTGEIIRRFNSSMDIQRKLGLSNGSINDCVNGKRNRQTLGGYRWIRA